MQYAKVRGYVCVIETTRGGCALIAVDPRKVDLTPIPLGDADRARVGEPVVVLHRYSGLGSHLTSTAMDLAAVWHDVWTGNVKTVTALRTDSELDPSGLGAPLIDTGGKVIGWVTPIPWLCFNDSTGDHSSSVASSTVSVSLLRGLLDTMGSFHSGRRTWLAVYGTSVDDFPEIPKALGLPVSHGFLVQIVDPRELAARAGIRGGNRVKMVTLRYGGRWQLLTGGDIIVAIDGRAVRTLDDYNKVLDGHKPDDVVTVKFYRDTGC